MITERQKECYRAYVQEGTYQKAAQKLDLSEPTVYEQVQTVQNKVEEVFEVLGVIDDSVVGATEFGLIYVQDEDSVRFVEPGEAEQLANKMKEPYRSKIIEAVSEAR